MVEKAKVFEPICLPWVLGNSRHCYLEGDKEQAATPASDSPVPQLVQCQIAVR